MATGPFNGPITYDNPVTGGEYPVTWDYTGGEALIVRLLHPDADPVELAHNIDWTLTPDEQTRGGGILTLLASVPTGTTEIEIDRDTPATDTTNLPPNQAAAQAAIERMTMIHQEVKRLTGGLVASAAAAATSAAEAAQSAALVAGLVAGLPAVNFTDAYTVAEFAATAYPDNIQIVATAGQFDSRDRGGIVAVRVDQEPVHGHMVRTADRLLPNGTTDAVNGGYWEIIPMPDRVTSLEFGIRGDDSADEIDKLQKMIDYVIYHQQTTNSATPLVVILVGVSQISRTLQIGYGVQADPAPDDPDIVAFNGGIIVTGVGVKRRLEAGNGGSGLRATFTNAPIINVQGMRNVVVTRLAIAGGLDFTGFDFGQERDLPGFDGHDAPVPAELEANWAALGGDGRYNPHAGITIDAYSGDRPVTSYPDVVYPDWLGEVDQWGKGQSSGVYIGDMFISHVNTNVAIHPGDFSGNGDYIYLHNLFFEYSMYGISSGDGQGRTLSINLVNTNRLWCVLTNDTHGRQQGQFGGPIIGLSTGGYCFRLMKFNATSTTGPIKFINCDTESLEELGEIDGAASSDVSIEFDHCTFNFISERSLQEIAGYVLKGSTNAAIVFRACVFQGIDSVLAFQPRNTLCDDACSFQPRSAFASPYEKVAHNNLMGAMLDPLTPKAQSILGIPFNLDSGNAVPVTPQLLGPAYDCTDRDHTWSIWAQTARRNSRDGVVSEPVHRPTNTIVVGRSAVTFAFGSGATGRSVTMTFTSMTDEKAMLQGYAPGDVIRDRVTGTVWFIRSRTGAVIEAEMQNNWRKDSAGNYHIRVPIDESNGQLDLIKSGVYTPRAKIEGDADGVDGVLRNCWVEGPGGGYAAGSAEAIAAGGPDPLNGAVPVGHDLENNISAGDWYYAQVPGMVPIPADAGAEVSAVSNATDEITMAGATIRARTSALDAWLRQPPANQATR